jgi:Tol biopolymer transport system component
MTATRKGDPRNRIWLQPLPQGEPRQITNDFNVHREVSVTADGRSLTALSSEFDGELHLSSPDDPVGGTPLDSERSSRVNQVCASATGAVAYTRLDDIASNIMILDSPQAQPRSLTSDGKSLDASISGDGKTIVYTSYNQDESHIWAVDAEGGAPRQVTQGSGEFLAEVSPDGKTVLYMNKDGLWRRALAGGQAVKLTDRPTGSHGFSHDGRLLYYRYWSAAEPRILMRVEPVGGGAPLMESPGRRGREYRFTPKDDGVTFIAAAGGADNLFVQKLDGSEPVQVTKFRRGGIESYDWTKDGKLVYIRSEQRSDVVMYTGF